MALILISRPVSNIVAKYVHNGSILTQGTDFYTVFQAVIDSYLTGGRTEQDTIICYGDYDLDGNIALDSLLKLIMSGANITSVGSAGSSGMFQASSKNNIDIVSGTFDGDSIAPYVLYANGCSGITAEGVRALNAANHGINITDSSHFLLSKNIISGCNDDCITTLNSSDGAIDTNILWVGPGTSGGSHGIEIEGNGTGGSQRITASSNIIDTTNTVTVNQIGGILVDSNAAQGLCSDITLRANVISNMPSRGIEVRAQGVSEWIKNVTTGGNILTDCGDTYAMAFTQVDGASSDGDIIKGTAPAGRHGFGITGTTATPSKNIGINNLQIDGVRRSGIHITNATKWAVTSPKIKNVGQEGASAKYAIQTVPSTTDYDYGGSSIRDIQVSDDQGVATTYGLLLTEATNVTVDGGSIGSEVLSTVGATGGLKSSVKISNLGGFVTEAAGSETSAGTTIVVSHGLDRTPIARQIHLTPTNATAGADDWYVDTITSSNFTIHCTSGATFDWEIKEAGSDV